MHELPVTQGILDVILKAAAGNQARRISAVHLVVGELSSIVDDSVQFYFDVLSRDTIAAGAALHFRRIAATATCRDCAHTYAMRAPLDPACPRCGGTHVQVSGGREFYVESIDVDDSNDDADANPEVKPDSEVSA